MKRTILLTLLIAALSITGLLAEDFGSVGALAAEEYTLEEMLQYAMEDEYTALEEYKALMEEFGLTRPYSNIAESEKTHIALLEELYNELGMDIPQVDPSEHLVLPSSPAEAAEIGVKAEIYNIDMYRKFLEQDLPDNVRDTFTRLMKASENHLKAFQRQVSRSR